MTFRHLGDELRHRGHIWNLVLGRYEAPDGTRFERDIVRSPGSVGVVATLADTDEPTIVLVQQYRPSVDTEVVEIPVGMRDVPGEPPEVTAVRELAEEAGLAPGGPVDKLTDILPSSGMTDAVCTIYLATGCTEVANDLQGPEEEYLEVLPLPLADAVERVASGEIVDSKTVVGILLAARRLL